MDPEHTLTAVVTAIVAILGSGGISALLLHKTNTKIGDATADKTAAEAWALLAEKLLAQIAQMQSIIDTLRKRVDTLEEDKTAADQRVDDLEAEIVELREWIIKQGLTPPPRKVKPA